MTTVAILPIESAAGSTTYQAVSEGRLASGGTAGAALDALSAQFPELDSEPLVVVQRFRPDQFFSQTQQHRLHVLMERWRYSREGGNPITTSELAELEGLIEAELTAAGRRARAVAERTGR